ncbi:MAG: LegC family aminotransferase [Candidatus Thioglobus sp.]|jgi:aminotransferase in exopolysaccharide biosynthesis
MNSFPKELVSFVRDQYGTKDFIPLHAPHFEGKEKEYLLDTIDSTFVSTVGAYVTQFEEKVAQYTGSKYAVATVNGTSALHVGLLVAGVQRDDEVITQSLTFVATCNAIRYCGAEPVFVDVERETLGMSPDSILDFLDRFAEMRDGLCWNKQTNRVIRACVPMHNFGHPVRIHDIQKICQNYNIQLVEDAAESLGSFYEKIHTGRFGSLAAISFNGNKIITTGGGGMIITDDEVIYKRVKHITTTAKVDHPWLYMHDDLGFNYRLPNLNAALGCAQMELLSNYVERKRALAERYANWFSDKGYKFILEPENTKANYWINAFLVNGREERDEILKYTNNNKVMTRPAWTPMHTLKMFKDNLRVDLTNTEWLESRLVNIPSSVI